MGRTPKHNLPQIAADGAQTRKSDESQHTADHKDCPACIEANLLLIQIDSDFSRLPFSQAATLWMVIRRQRRNLKPRTHESTQGYIDALEKFFGAIRLCDITPGHLHAYQLARAANSIAINGREVQPWKHMAGHSIVNHEISTLGQILKHCKLWEKLQPYYSPEGIPKWSPRDILSEEDEEDLFSKGASHPEAALAYWVACITDNTTAAGCELRGLQLKNIFLRTGKDISEIYIPKEAVKNSSRPRKISLNRTARWAVEQCYKRALSLGCTDPEHYLFPFRLNRVKRNEKVCVSRAKWDPERPATRWFLRKSWEKLRKATGFTQLNPHDLRHQCITRLLENGVEPETVRAIAGHVTEQMMQYYSHHRRQTKYNAVMAIELDQQKRRKQGPQPVRRTA
jgi:integrase